MMVGGGNEFGSSRCGSVDPVRYAPVDGADARTYQAYLNENKGMRKNGDMGLVSLVKCGVILGAVFGLGALTYSCGDNNNIANKKQSGYGVVK